MEEKYLESMDLHVQHDGWVELDKEILSALKLTTGDVIKVFYVPVNAQEQRKNILIDKDYEDVKIPLSILKSANLDKKKDLEIVCEDGKITIVEGDGAFTNGYFTVTDEEEIDEEIEEEQ